MIIYDIEIKNAIPPARGSRDTNVVYCEGWDDYPGMGIACIGVYDYRADRYRVFLEDNLDEFRSLVEKSSIIIGFNNIKFDDQLCAANNIIIQKEKSYDLLVEMWRAAGIETYFKSWLTHGGYGLDSTCDLNFGLKKSGDGALAPVLWQRGKHGTVIDYCLNDIAMTKRLAEHVHFGRTIRSPKDGKDLDLRKLIPFSEFLTGIVYAPAPDSSDEITEQNQNGI